MSRRDQITMSSAEVGEFLAAEGVVVATTNGVRGWPHSMPLWYTTRAAGDAPEGEDPAPEAAGGVEVWAWTFSKSQKIKNLERDPRTTLLVEAGDTYDQLRGVMIEAQAILYTDFETCFALGKEIATRYTEGSGQLGPDAEAALEAQAAKRTVMRFHPVRLATWDHRKLGGGY